MRLCLKSSIKVISIFALSAMLSMSPLAMAKGHGGYPPRTSHSAGSHASYSKSPTARSKSAKVAKAPKALRSSQRAQGVQRVSHGKIARSLHAKNRFEKQHPCPSTGKTSGACPGYVIDHVKPLKRGGADAPSNMQWQTKEAAKQKDKTE